jgi:hypothetical protein
MKKVLVLLLMVIPILSGCWRYGTGKTNGYITTIENGIFWDVVYIRAELESSNTDGYVINKNQFKLKEELQEFADSKQRVQLLFQKHVMTACGAHSDEIVSYKILNQ